MSLTLDTSGNICVDGNSANVVAVKERMVTLTVNANRTLTQADSGKTFLLGQATANNVITLPAPFAGANFKFVATAASNGTNTWTITSSGANVKSTILGVTGSPAALALATGSGTSVVFSATANNTKASDYCHYHSSDGTNYYVFASGSGTAVGWSIS